MGEHPLCILAPQRSKELVVDGAIGEHADFVRRMLGLKQCERGESGRRMRGTQGGLASGWRVDEREIPHPTFLAPEG